MSPLPSQKFNLRNMWICIVEDYDPALHLHELLMEIFGIFLYFDDIFNLIKQGYATSTGK